MHYEFALNRKGKVHLREGRELKNFERPHIPIQTTLPHVGGPTSRTGPVGFQHPIVKNTNMANMGQNADPANTTNPNKKLPVVINSISEKVFLERFGDVLMLRPIFDPLFHT